MWGRSPYRESHLGGFGTKNAPGTSQQDTAKPAQAWMGGAAFLALEERPRCNPFTLETYEFAAPSSLSGRFPSGTEAQIWSLPPVETAFSGLVGLRIPPVLWRELWVVESSVSQVLWGLRPWLGPALVRQPAPPPALREVLPRFCAFEALNRASPLACPGHVLPPPILANFPNCRAILENFQNCRPFITAQQKTHRIVNTKEMLGRFCNTV